MRPLPPGNILQNIYMNQRVKIQNFSSFLEIGAGNGFLSNELLKLGLNGIGCDLNESACLNNKILNQNFINKNQYKINHGNFTSLNGNEVLAACSIHNQILNVISKYW